MPQHPETYEEALEQSIEVEKDLQQEKKERRAKPKRKVSAATQRARDIVLAKLAAR